MPHTVFRQKNTGKSSYNDQEYRPDTIPDYFVLLLSFLHDSLIDKMNDDRCPLLFWYCSIAFSKVAMNVISKIENLKVSIMSINEMNTVIDVSPKM